MEAYVTEFNKWMAAPEVSDEVKSELVALTEDEKKERFAGYMTFGTAGLRAKMGAGCAFMNEYTVAHATEGLARLILAENAADRGVAIAAVSTVMLLRAAAPRYSRRRGSRYTFFRLSARPPCFPMRCSSSAASRE